MPEELRIYWNEEDTYDETYAIKLFEKECLKGQKTMCYIWPPGGESPITKEFILTIKDNVAYLDFETLDYSDDPDIEPATVKLIFTDNTRRYIDKVLLKLKKDTDYKETKASAEIVEIN